MRPNPTMPSVLPLARTPSISRMPKLRPQPSRMMALYSHARRQAHSSSMNAKSAVQSVSTSGVFVTTRPRALAAGTSMWSNPTLQVAATRTLAGSRPITSGVSFRLLLRNSASARCSAHAAITSSGVASFCVKASVSNCDSARATTASGTGRAITNRFLSIASLPIR